MHADRWFTVTLIDEELDPGADAAYHDFKVYAYSRSGAITSAYAQADAKEKRRVPYAVDEVR